MALDGGGKGPYQSRVIPRARAAFVGMLMGTYKPRARFVRGSTMIAAKVTRRR